ncbi:TPA: SDR family NAD(P)-dependent oxidoreductase, partial [Escherichia coli]|nr:SDR family NAD(P)-dependent oxidoreductase [Escherichia coli]
MLLKNKVAIVTGAASVRGLGFATAKLFAENGAKVVIIDLNKEASETAAKSLGDGHLGLAANVADEAQVSAAMEQVVAKYGRVDVLVNNAGITQPIKLMDI